MSPEMLVARISVMQPWLGSEEARAVEEVIASGWVGQGPKVSRFERVFADVHQAPHAVATSSGTAALHLALAVAGIGSGDHVVVPALAYPRVARAVSCAGAHVVPCDVDPKTGNATAATIRAALTMDTRAAIVTDQGGIPADLDPIREFCRRHSVAVIEDAAQSVGSRYKGLPVGIGADVAVWSFGRDGIVTTGEGGMLTTARADWADRARTLRELVQPVPGAIGRSPRSLHPARPTGGYDYKMTDLQAAVGLAQLRRLELIVERRREIAAAYAAGLSDIKGLRLVTNPPHGTTNFQSFWLEVLPSFTIGRERLLDRLEEAGIEATAGLTAACRWLPVPGPGIGTASQQNACQLSERAVVLPMYHQLDVTAINRVINTIRASAAGVVQ